MDKTNNTILSGDYLRGIFPEDDPKMESFYEKYPFMKDAELDFSSSEEKSPKDYNNHFFDTEWLRIQNQKFESGMTKPGHCQIGTVVLTVPPSQIAISDVKNNFTYPMIRSRGDITLQSGHTNKIIELDIIFHDVDSINNKLRPLLAQLRCTPFIPIENEYIRSVILPQDLRLKGFSAEREGRVDEYLKNRKEYTAQIEIYEDDMKKLINETTFYKIDVGDEANVVTEKTEKEKVLKRRLSLLADDSLDPTDRGQIELDRSVAYNVNKEFGIAREVGAESKASSNELEKIADTVKKIEGFETKKNSYKGRLDDSFKFLPTSGIKGGIVPTILSQITISTVPGAPEALACHLSLFVFNSFPYSADFSFRKTVSEAVKVCPHCRAENDINAIVCYSCRHNIKDSNEDTREYITPTKKIDECDSFVKWYSKVFLSDRDGAVRRLESHPTNHVNFETTRQSRRVVDGKSQDFQAILNLDTSYFLSAECVSIAISFSNKIKFLPIIGYGIPTCQFLGSNSASVSMTFSSFPEKNSEEDIFLESMRFLFDQVDATSRETLKDNRRAWVRVDNDLIKMMGIKNLIPQSFDVNTVPGTPGMSATTLRFIDINTTFEKREKIRLVNAASDARIDAFIENEIEKWFDGENKELWDAQGRISNQSVIDDCLDELKTTGYKDAFLPRHSTLGLFYSESGHLIDKRDDLMWASGPTDKYIYKYYSAAAKSAGYSIKKAKYTDKERESQYRGKGISVGYGKYKIEAPDALAAWSGKYQTRLDSIGFDTITVKRKSDFDWEPLSSKKGSSRETIFNKVVGSFSRGDSGTKAIDKAFSRLLFRGTRAGQRQIDKWTELIKKKEIGQGYFPDNVEEILEREKTSMQRDPEYWTYEDLDLPVYEEIGIGYAPSFSDLGIATPKNSKPGSYARHKYDIVEPDFYFDHLRLKDQNDPRATFNYDAGAWGKNMVSYGTAVAAANKMHSVQGEKVREDVIKDIQEQGTVEKQEKTDEKNQENVGTVDQPSKESVPNDKAAKIASRLPIEGMAPSEIIEGFVTKVIDGDTIMIDGYDERIRIIGISAPEIEHLEDGSMDEENSSKESKAATEYLSGLVLNKNVRLRVDKNNFSSKNRGVYGRPLMYVFLVGAGGEEEDVGGKLLDAGLVEAKSDFPNVMYANYAERSHPNYKPAVEKDVWGNYIPEPGTLVFGGKGVFGDFKKELEKKKTKNQQ